MREKSTEGFTLIELSIVLVIIGLIVGGVLVGQDLIRAAEVRATISQVEKFNTATNTFRGKFGALPGDLNQTVASTFGFAARGQNAGEGDGNGIIQGFVSNSYESPCGFCPAQGEAGMFWVDLTTANGLNLNMIPGSFNTNTPTFEPNDATGTTIDLYLPQAKIGRGNYIYVWSGGPTLGWNGTAETGSNGINYYGISVPIAIFGWALTSSPGLAVAEAHNIDKKMDDGLPQSGRVTANYLAENVNYESPIWAGSGGVTGMPYTTSVTGGPTTCFDNGGGNGPQQYSLEINNGAGVNCALSFQFQ